ncbi:hypothetical protein VitviT2T_023459 [Vitis vinifera]|uniref:Uncharacterized protein n=1 Tax=Vitis vinifera TaxID=29760 RepID=A0ABY9DEX1_VITVI|nr:hypothetical protein VitviT2T_023459 [Vitis vinifera]
MRTSLWSGLCHSHLVGHSHTTPLPSGSSLNHCYPPIPKPLPDISDKGKLVEWLCSHSTKSGDELTSLGDYITGESKKVVESSPFLEKLKKKGYEFLFMVDAIDEYAVGHLKEFEGRSLSLQPMRD